MNKFIFLTFAFLAWAFYEMSGGSDFQPGTAVAEATATSAEPVQVSTQSAAPASAEIATKAVVTDNEATDMVTRASVTQPEFDLRKPDKAELAALDPAVLASFGDVLKPEAAKIDAKVQPAAVTGEPTIDLRQVTGNRVNMRNGPGTDYSVVSRLTRGEEVEVLADPGQGWLKLRVAETGRIGWMADFLVTAAAN